jgi:hypothetical protein
MAYDPENPAHIMETLGHVGEGIDYNASSATQLWGFATADDPELVESEGYFPGPGRSGPSFARGDVILASMRKRKGLTPCVRFYAVVEGVRSGDPANVLAPVG